MVVRKDNVGWACLSKNRSVKGNLLNQNDGAKLIVYHLKDKAVQKLNGTRLAR